MRIKIDDMVEVITGDDRGQRGRVLTVDHKSGKTSLEQNILYLLKRQWVADVHHHREADYLGRTVETTERVAYCRRLRNLARRL